MKIVEVIEKLVKIKEEHGNLRVNHAYDGLRISFYDDNFFIIDEPLYKNTPQVKQLCLGHDG